MSQPPAGPLFGWKTGHSTLWGSDRVPQAAQPSGYLLSHQVTKTVKTVTTRTVRQVPMGPDGLPLLDGGPTLGHFADGPLDRHFLLRGGGQELEPDYGTVTRRRPDCGRGLRTR